MLKLFEITSAIGHGADSNSSLDAAVVDVSLLAAEAYIMQNQYNMRARFDLIAIVINSSRNQIEHIEGVFVPGVE